MILELKRTEYNMEYNGINAKASLSYHEGKGEVSIFIEGQLVYYLILDDSYDLEMDEVELSRLMTNKLEEDRTRWIKDCSLIVEHKRDFTFVNKVAIYNCEVGAIRFTLRLTSMDTKENLTSFKIEAFSDKTEDYFQFDIKAINNQDLNNKLTKYAEAIVIIAAEFGLRRDELVNSTFARK